MISLRNRSLYDLPFKVIESIESLLLLFYNILLFDKILLIVELILNSTSV